MAEFSKQYVEQSGFDYPHDFDILEIAAGLEPGYYIPYICEGYGFVAIQKSENGEILLGMPKGEDMVEWVTFNKLIEKEV
jgi:hypothetical protein